MESLTLKDAAETLEWGRELGRSLTANTALLLFGDLGAGKTTLVQGLGEGLGIRDPIVSPTFTLINEYLEGRLPLYHLDLYRLNPADVIEVNPEMYWEGIEVTPGITAIEWAQRLPYKPPNYLAIYLELAGDRARTIRVHSVRE
ncbi:MAG: tRNA (adenosine(37)-N6)-threonylcarbamoyltransferase complex ATPase subunit type 1 TsaE [Cyanobacteria bacterium P01_E01_bin.42]